MHKEHKHVSVIAHNTNTLASEGTQNNMLCYDDISLLMCGTEIMLISLYITNYLYWHVADTSNRENMLLYCICLVFRVE